MYEIIFRNCETNEELITFGRDIATVREKQNLGAEWFVEHYDYID